MVVLALTAAVTLGVIARHKHNKHKKQKRAALAAAATPYNTSTVYRDQEDSWPYDTKRQMPSSEPVVTRDFSSPTTPPPSSPPAYNHTQYQQQRQQQLYLTPPPTQANDMMHYQAPYGAQPLTFKVPNTNATREVVDETYHVSPIEKKEI